MNHVAERIEIINSYRQFDADRNKPLAKRIMGNSIFLYINIALVIIVTTILIWGILVTWNILHSGPAWGKMSLFIIFSIVFIDKLFPEIYKNLLLKHLMILEGDASLKVNSVVNDELRAIITSLNKPKRSYLIVAIAIIMLVSACANYFWEQGSPHYNLVIFPTILFYALSFYEGLQTYKQIKSNLNNAFK